MKKLISLFLFLFLAVGTISAQKNDDIKMPINFGLYGGVNYNLHTPHFKYIWMDANNPLNSLWITDFNENGSGFGGAVGAIGNFPITDIFTFSLRAGYNMLDGKFEKTEMSVDVETQEPVEINSAFDASLGFFELTPAIQLHNLLPVKPLYFLLGLELGFPVNYTYRDEASTNPPGYLTSTNDEIDLKKPETRIALAAGLGYTFTLAENIFLSPEASFRLPFNDLYKEDYLEPVPDDTYNASWNASQIRLGVNLTFGLFDDKAPEIVETPKESSMKVNFADVRSYDNEGNSRPARNIRVEQVQYTELFPLLPYVFYEAGSGNPDPKEQKMVSSNEAGAFSIETLEPDALQINRSTLDIIGTRMVNNPSANLTITGTIDAKSKFETPKVASSRAELAKKYLVDKYKIDQNRIAVKSTNLPAKASSSNDPEGVQENRRIEFASNNPAILAPIIIERDKQTISTPRMIEFVPEVTTTDPIAGWQLEIAQGGKVLRRFNGEGQPEAQQWMVLPNELAANEIPVDYTFTATNTAGKRDSKSGSIPVEYISQTRSRTENTPDKIISKYSLNLFDFDSPVISEFDKEILRNHVIPAIKYNSVVQIQGFTDRIGDAEYNKKLALQRAQNVKDFLAASAKAIRYETSGLGEDVKLFDNSSPVGRHLSRTVQIYITTPKE